MQNMSTTTKTPERPLPPPGPQEARDLLGAVVAARDAGRAAARSVEAKIDRLDPRFATEAMLDEVRAIRAAAATAQEARLALLRPRVQRILACTAEAYRRETLRRASFASDPVADATLRSDARQTGLLAAGPDLVSAARDAAASGAVALAHTLRTVAEHRHDLGTLSVFANTLSDRLGDTQIYDPPQEAGSRRQGRILGRGGQGGWDAVPTPGGGDRDDRGVGGEGKQP